MILLVFIAFSLANRLQDYIADYIQCETANIALGKCLESKRKDCQSGGYCGLLNFVCTANVCVSLYNEERHTALIEKN